MKCEQVDAKLISLVYGELPEDERAAIEEHVTSCEACSREATMLRKAHALLDEAVEERPASSELAVAQVTQRVVQRTERSRRRWRAFACLSASAAVVLAIMQLLSLRITVDANRFELAWGSSEQTERDFEPPSPPLPSDDLVPVIDQHKERFEDLDRLVHFLIRLNEAENRGHDRELAAVQRQVDSLQTQHETWQRTLAYLIRNGRLSDDLAQQPITPTRLEGDFE